MDRLSIARTLNHSDEGIYDILIRNGNMEADHRPLCTILPMANLDHQLAVLCSDRPGTLSLGFYPSI